MRSQGCLVRYLIIHQTKQKKKRVKVEIAQFDALDAGTDTLVDLQGSINDGG